MNGELKLHCKLWLSTSGGEGIMGDGKWRLIREVNRLGSLTAASKELGISYRKAWGDIKAAEKLLDMQLLKRSRGGKDHGHSQLTLSCIKYMEAWDDFHQGMQENLADAFAGFIKKIEA